MLPLNLPELEVSGLALVTAIDDCPPIACGEGSVVTARFVTREVHVVASVDVLGADGTVETITGTTIHPVWSVNRQEWVPLDELADGETLQGLDGLAVVLSVSLSRVSQPVYNIEVHGEHVYQVGELGLVVHNTCPLGQNLPILNRHFTPASQFVGKQAIVSAHLPAGRFTALVVDGQVYVARMHNVAWELAGRKGVEQFYGFCEIDALGKVVRLFK
jgi:hypothetical protein